MHAQTISDLAAAAFRDLPGSVLLAPGAAGTSVQTAEIDRRTRELAAALVTYGLDSGAKAAVLTEDGGEALIGVLSVLRAGGTAVLLDPAWTGPQLLDLLTRTSARQVLVANELLLGRILEIRPELPDLDLVLLFRGSGESRAAALTVAEACVAGAASLAGEPDLLDPPASPGGADAAVLVWTGEGEGGEVVYTHANLLAAVGATGAALGIECGATVLAALPAFDLTFLVIALACLERGAALAHLVAVEELGAALLAVRPTLAVLPRSSAGALRRHIESAVGAKGWLGGKLLRFAIGQGMKRGQADLAAGRLPVALTWGWRAADALVIWRVRRAVGGRLAGVASLGPPLPAGEAEFFLAAGLSFLEGLACQEAGGLVAVNRPAALRPGTAGLPVPGVEIRAGTGGRLEIRGPMIPGDVWRSVPFQGQIDSGGFLQVATHGEPPRVGTPLP